MANQNKPRSSAEQRPNNKPVYIDSNCHECGTSLVLVDILETHPVQKDKIWQDEFIALSVEMDYILMFQQGSFNLSITPYPYLFESV